MEPYDEWNHLLKESLPMDLLTLASLCFLDEHSIYQLVRSDDSLNESHYEGWTALMYACSFGHDETIEHLLSQGVDCKVRNSNGQNALIIAIINGLSSVERLIKFSDLNIQDVSSRTALHYAVELDFEDIVHSLVEAGACLNEPSDSTPLMLSAEQGKLSFVKYLVKSGANYYLQDRSGRNAEEIARKNGHSAVSSYLKLIKAPSIYEVLSFLGIAKFYPLFEQKSISFMDFVRMNEEDIKAIGINLIGPRRKLSIALLELRQIMFKKI